LFNHQYVAFKQPVSISATSSKYHGSISHVLGPSNDLCIRPATHNSDFTTGPRSGYFGVFSSTDQQPHGNALAFHDSPNAPIMSTISDSQDNMFDSSDLTSCGDNESSPNTVATDVTTKSKSHHSPHQRGRLFPSRCIVSPFGGQAEEGLPLNRSAKFTSPYTPVPGAEANYNDSAPWHASLQNQIDWDSYASMQLSQYNMSEEPHSVNLSLGCYETTESQPSPDKHDEISVTKATILGMHA
jgi:hypothetical protein